jgi:hypothetical protein
MKPTGFRRRLRDLLEVLAPPLDGREVLEELAVNLAVFERLFEFGHVRLHLCRIRSARAVAVRLVASRPVCRARSGQCRGLGGRWHALVLLRGGVAYAVHASTRPHDLRH